jgi:predicted permease
MELVFSNLSTNLNYILQCNIAKFIFMPIITILLSYVFQLEENMRYIAVLYSCMPTSGVSHALAKELGGDDEGMKTIMTTMIISSLLSLAFFTYIIS